VATSTEITFAVTGFGSRMVVLSTRKMAVSMIQVVPPTKANFNSSRCRIATAR